ncbi:rhodanese-like domain-containing protein [Tetragenococcus halophilus]|uniref:Rhodanese-like domain-containing protein n=1 Tax=Tetragenococcus halophilus TaxID=51669 RepID=A0AB37D4F9_TETHA|nr:rhodanese-like domain-containing protein [Tetragenococcus halophilus]MCO8292283.1 rhodanese-like domain-containing protein [Tetragenococcus halophilus]QGP76933.1 rhodanese-like domain-containing protein [Tetragenococcus halophilus]
MRDTTQSIAIQDFRSLLEESIAILDIRDKGAYKENHLAGAISIPTTSLPNRLSELDKSTTYYVLSHSGRRSEIIAEFLNNNGFQAIHVIGGMKALKKAAA